MDYKALTLDELRHKRGYLSSKLAVVGLDGFVDKIVTPVALRQGQGDAFTPIDTLEEFGKRIVAAAGKSTNIELYPRLEKLGGNGPIMANALLGAGARVKYIGALGAPTIHPVFQEMAGRADAVTLCDPGVTVAIEFTDGKLMLGTMASLDEINYHKITAAMGEDALVNCLNQADLIALTNWTMIPNMTAIFTAFVEQALPQLTPKDRRFFFDLADPEKRSHEDLHGALQAIARFESFGKATLGLNLKEAQQVYELLGFSAVKEDERGLRTMAEKIRGVLGISVVVIHPKESAACADERGSYWVAGPYVERPLITTGAGDHFNAGFSAGQLLGLSPTASLTVGVSTSGYYVRTARSPSIEEIETFLTTWK